MSMKNNYFPSTQIPNVSKVSPTRWSCHQNRKYLLLKRSLPVIGSGGSEAKYIKSSLFQQWTATRNVSLNVELEIVLAI